MIETYANQTALAEAAAHAIGRALAQGIATRGRAALVATGGRSPGPVFDVLTAAPVDWTRVVVTLSDERCAPADDAASNQRLVRERLLVGEARKAHLIPLWPKPDPAALTALLPFDAVMLGMGEDGHVASLLPGDPALAAHLDPQGAALVVDVPAGLGRPPMPRVSLTLKALLASRAIFLLIAGQAKREVFERALMPGPGGEDLPVRALLTQDQVPLRVLWTPN